MFPVIPGHTALLFSVSIRFSLSDPSPICISYNSGTQPGSLQLHPD